MILGTDIPSGTGVTPRGMLRIMVIAAAVAGVKPEEVICMATGSVALAHNLYSGFVQEEKPADLLIPGKIQGSSGDTPLEALKEGNLLGISVAIVDGKMLIQHRSQQAPPHETTAIIETKIKDLQETLV